MTWERSIIGKNPSKISYTFNVDNKSAILPSPKTLERTSNKTLTASKKKSK